jgi:hypothetical protein
MEILDDIQRQLADLVERGQKPALIKMSPDTWSALAGQPGVLSQEGLHEMKLFNLRVMLDQAVRTGVARVYREWESC